MPFTSLSHSSSDARHCGGTTTGRMDPWTGGNGDKIIQLMGGGVVGEHLPPGLQKSFTPASSVVTRATLQKDLFASVISGNDSSSAVLSCDRRTARPVVVPFSRSWFFQTGVLKAISQEQGDSRGHQERGWPWSSPELVSGQVWVVVGLSGFSCSGNHMVCCKCSENSPTAGRLGNLQVRWASLNDGRYFFFFPPKNNLKEVLKVWNPSVIPH